LLEPLLPGLVPGRGGQWANHRRVIDGVLWRTRCGATWRDVPASYGPWKTVYNRHRRWSGDGTWEQVLDRLRTGADHDDEGRWLLGVGRHGGPCASSRGRRPQDTPEGRVG